MIRAIHCFLVAVTLFSVGIEYWGRDIAYRQQFDESSIAGENIAQAAIEHADATLNIAAWTLDGIVERVEAEGAIERNRDRLKRYMLSRIQKQGSPLQGLFVYDRDGRWSVATVDATQADAHDADRPHVTYHRLHADRGVHVGAPIPSPSTGEWVVPVSRRLDDGNGRFAGVVLATIPVRRFDQYYKRFSLGRAGAILLATSDGTVLTRLPTGHGVTGSNVGTTPLFRYVMQSGKDHGTAMLMTQYDQVERLQSFRRSSTYPLLFAVAQSKDEIFAGWLRMTVQEVCAVAVMTIITWIGGLWLVAQLRARARLEAALRDTHATLELRNAELDRMARTDGLTGLYNRRYLDERLAAELARAARDGTRLALIMIDVDYFKRYNDTYGHAEGDACLRMVAQAIGAAVHRPADVAARFGGEEFAVLLPNTELEGALRIADAIRAAVAGQRQPHGASDLGIVTISAGVATLAPPARTEVLDLVQAADASLYAAKEAGRNNVQPAPVPGRND